MKINNYLNLFMNLYNYFLIIQKIQKIQKNLKKNKRIKNNKNNKIGMINGIIKQKIYNKHKKT